MNDYELFAPTTKWDDTAAAIAEDEEDPPFLYRQQMNAINLFNQTNIWHGPDVGVPKSVPARTDFEKFVQIFSLLTGAIAWDSTVECQFYI